MRVRSVSPRAAVFAVFATFGVTVGAFGGAIPALLRQTGVGTDRFGLMLTVMTLATVVAMSVGGFVARKASNRAVLLAAMPLLALAQGAVLISPDPVMLLVAMVALGALLGLTDCIMNVEASAIETDLGRPVFTAFHALAALSVAPAAIGGSWVAQAAGAPAAALLAPPVALLAGVLVWRGVPARALSVTPAPTAGIEAAPRLLGLPLVLIGLSAGLVIACETAAIFWSGKLLDTLAPDLAAISGLGVAFFASCTAAVRFLGDPLRRRVGDGPLMLASMMTAIVGLGGLWLSDGFVAAVVSLAVFGFGAALLCPCLFNMATRAVPWNRAGGLGFAMMVAGAPRIAMPFVFGLVAADASIRTAFGLCAALMAVALVLVVMLNRGAPTTRPVLPPA